MKTKPTPKANKASPQNRASRRPGVALQRLARPLRGKQKDAHKEAWMAGATAGTEVAFDLIMRSLENMAKGLGIKRRKRPNGADELPAPATRS